MRGPYAGYDVLAKWTSPSFDDKTRATIAARLAAPPEPRFFDAAAFAALQAVVTRLAPQDGRREPIPIAHWIDRQLTAGEGEGYRNEHMPPQAEAWRRGLAGVRGEARRRHGADFADLAPDQQDGVLRAIQAGDVGDAEWRGLDPRRFFRDALLRLVAALAYAHPSAWNEIGFGGPASPRGYVRLGFDARDSWEAREQP